uniref:Ovule protein n=1 Tax=Mesocestoides corti TaxID=53468 RepID=A0A5K3ENG0_MESCO
MAVVVDISFPPSSDGYNHLDEWTDFESLPLPALVQTVFGRLSQPPSSDFTTQLCQLRESLTVVTEVRPLEVKSTNRTSDEFELTNVAYAYSEKWNASSLVECKTENCQIRRIFFSLPERIMKGVCLDVVISVFIEMPSDSPFIVYPLRRRLFSRTTNAFDWLRVQPLSVGPTADWLTLPIRIPDPHVAEQFQSLFRGIAGFSGEGAVSTLSLRHNLFAEASIFVEVKESGFRIASHNSAALWHVYQAFQHYMNEFNAGQAQSVTVADLRNEFVVLEALESQLLATQNFLKPQNILDMYAFLRNSKSFGLLTLYKANSSTNKP